jgi:hypothetical protein
MAEVPRPSPSPSPSPAPRLTPAFVLSCLRPGSIKSPGSKFTLVPGEEHILNPHQHVAALQGAGEWLGSAVASLPQTGARGQGHHPCPGCMAQSTAELNAESPGSQQS